MKRFVIACLVAWTAFIVGGLLPVGDMSKKVCNAIFLAALAYIIFKSLAFLFGKKKEPTKTYKKTELFKVISGSVFANEINITLEKANAYIEEKKLSPEKAKEEVKKSLYPIVMLALEDGILSHEEEEKIEKLISTYGITADDIDGKTKELLVKGALIRDLLDGTVKTRVDASAMPFKLMKNEIPVWGYDSIDIAEMRNVSQFQGGSQGVSVKIAKGVYYRVGKVAAQRVTSKELKELGKGIVFITSHHLFYQVGADSKRIKHDKIFSIAPFADGVVVYLDGSNAKPLIFKTDDSWFLSNVLQNAQNWDQD